MTMFEEICDFLLQPLATVRPPLGRRRRGSATRADRLLGSQLLAHLGHGPQDRLGQFFEDVEFAKLRPQVTDPEITEYYEKNKEEFREQEQPQTDAAPPGTPPAPRTGDRG